MSTSRERWDESRLREGRCQGSDALPERSSSRGAVAGALQDSASPGLARPGPEQRLAARGPFRPVDTPINLCHRRQLHKHRDCWFLPWQRLPPLISSLDTAPTALLSKKKSPGIQLQFQSIYKPVTSLLKDSDTKNISKRVFTAPRGPHFAMSIRLWREVGTQVFSPCTNTTPLSM